MAMDNNLIRTINDKAKDIEALKVKSSKVKGIDADKVDLLAERLVEKFNSPISRQFYCLVAWYIPEREIWLMVETAQSKARYSPGGYFHALVARALRKYGIYLKSSPTEKMEFEYQSELVPEEETETMSEESQDTPDLDDFELSKSDDEPINLDDIPF